MKHLMTVASYIDESLSFLQQCRKTGPGAIVTFKEVKESVEKSHAKTINENHFRQILTLCPELYNHSWEKVGSSIPQLAIDFTDGKETKYS